MYKNVFIFACGSPTKKLTHNIANVNRQQKHEYQTAPIGSTPSCSAKLAFYIHLGGLICGASYNLHTTVLSHLSLYQKRIFDIYISISSTVFP